MDIISESDALAIWSRAAQLQDEASSSRTAIARTDEIRDRSPVSLDPATRAPAGMYTIAEVTDAARDAGISPEFVALAVAEHDALGGNAAVAGDLPRAQRDMIIGTKVSSLRVSRVISDAPDVVLHRLREGAANAPLHLEFDALIGPSPLEGGVLRFRLPGLVPVNEHTGKRGSTTGFLYHAARAGVQYVHVTVSRRGTPDAPSCEVTLTVDLRPGHHVNATNFASVSGFLFGMFSFGGLILGASKFRSVLGAVGGGVAGFAAVYAYSGFMAWLHRWELRTGRNAMTQDLTALLARVQRPSDEARAFGSASAVRPRLVRGD